MKLIIRGAEYKVNDSVLAIVRSLITDLSWAALQICALYVIYHFAVKFW